MKLPSPSGERARERGVVLAVCLCLAACAPTSVAPSIIRLQPPRDRDSEFQLGVRTGPRLTAVIQSESAGSFNPAVGGTLPPELGAAYELDYTRVVWRQLAVHGGVQAEFFGGLPLPALGLAAGVSYRWQAGIFSIAPAIAGRGATSFAVDLVGGKGHILSADLSLTVSAAGSDRARIGLVPFASLQRTFGPDVTNLFFGGLVVVRFETVEVFGGVGRAWLAPSGPAWNVPLVGVRVGGL
ncbi:MAG: hypothetical protein IT380_08920 [Myxococcales bacterium]|nr:hypothetical protein [Myxococcales bacterium]